MKKVVPTLFIWILCGGLLEAGHFFLPPRSLYHFQPQHYVFGNTAGYHRRAYFSTRPTYTAGICPSFSTSRPRVYQIVINSPAGMEIVRANTSDLIFRVHPSRALVYVDGKLIGNARDFSNQRERYPLIEGEHSLRIQFPGYEPFQTDMTVIPNRTLTLDIKLERILK